MKIKKPDIPPIRVVVHYPEKLSESIKRAKINRLYDILKPKFDDNSDTCDNSEYLNEDDEND